MHYFAKKIWLYKKKVVTLRGFLGSEPFEALRMESEHDWF